MKPTGRTEYEHRIDAYAFDLISFVAPAEWRKLRACHSCSDTLTARQPDGRYGCWYHFVPLQLALW